MSKKEMYAHSVQYELHNKIVDTLDLSSGRKFNLRQHARSILKHKQIHNEIHPRRDNDTPMPQSGGKDYVNEYFYYY